MVPRGTGGTDRGSVVGAPLPAAAPAALSRAIGLTLRSAFPLTESRIANGTFRIPGRGIPRISGIGNVPFAMRPSLAGRWVEGEAPEHVLDLGAEGGRRVLS